MGRHIRQQDIRKRRRRGENFPLNRLGEVQLIIRSTLATTQSGLSQTTATAATTPAPLL